MKFVKQRFVSAGLATLIVFSLFSSGIAVQRSGQAQSAPPATAAYVPAAAVFFVALDTHFLSPQWIQGSLLVQRLQEGASPEAIAEGLLGSAFEGGADIDIAPFVGGEIAVALLGGGDVASSVASDGLEIDVANAAGDLAENGLIVAMPESADLAEATLLEALGGEALDRGVEVLETAYEGITIRSIEADSAQAIPGVAIARAGDAIFVASTPQLLEASIDLAAGNGESIADMPGFEAAFAPLPEDRIAVGLLNGPAILVDAMSENGIGVAIDAFIPGGSAAITGFAVSSQAEGFQIDTRTVSTNGSPIRTFGEHIDAELLERLPADTQIAISGNDLSQTRLVDGVVTLLLGVVIGALGEMFVPADGAATPAPIPTTLDEAADTAYLFAEAFLGIDVQDDLIGLIDGEFVFGVWNTSGEFGDPVAGFVSNSSDIDTLGETVDSVTLAASFLIGETSATGATGLSEFSVGGGAIEIGVINEQLVVGFNGGGAALATEPDEALIDSDIYQVATQPLPTERSLLVFINIQSIQEDPATREAPGSFGLEGSAESGPAFAFVTYNDGDELGGEGFFYIPEP